MKVQCFVIFLAALINSVLAAGYEPLEHLELGITKKVPSEQCEMQAMPGDTVSVHYSGMVRETSKEFDNSYNRGQPISFKLGIGQVIAGWDQGLIGMCIGEGRKIQIPSSMGYGARGVPGVIPENADLLFDVELVNIERN
ncbi:hypothetical protein Kpol_2000p105 [Vanderwaltozyma polyspora DSM 70294]|uniref:peptidylprolyl isomerase n=1 Tax=Vanderwaltozyma polyspora (strain ATCC 22028 / DSM 70294 / BCRC 21397 / CBS 2163 / NBRC 10782 / NRRL Y-8283 / UCD 57-17) TaxID=436907 RepID=A7TFB2_VANPO|nr:uncharacterized protein Kpol_2000p105 [Vanderwaltozyma polyspora DSM 70294]EDO19137.1 hypothetical protein Kpol_2000p105 [Vanderwaltozyma polyspora DSM 70294]